MANGRKKSHHSHEINDAYSEGWDARKLWRSGMPIPVNPYNVRAPIGLPPKKQSADRQEAQERDVEQWQEGWNDCEVDLKRGDLADVKPGDFRGSVWNIRD